ncbi:MAG: hypothetical protein V1720_00735 [bacterium]
MRLFFIDKTFNDKKAIGKLKIASKDPAADKIALIYEFDHNSPLFARVAAAEIEKNNIHRSIEILEWGMKKFPEYPTAYFIYSKALALGGRISEAKEQVKLGCEIIESDETLEFYLTEIEEIKKSVTDLSVSRRKAFFPEGVLENISNKPDLNAKRQEDESGINELSSLADKLRKAKMPILSSEIADEPNIGDFGFNEQVIVSETLAGIYYAQGNLPEAKSIYEKLTHTQPEKADFFRRKIDDINRQIEKQKLSDNPKT